MGGAGPRLDLQFLVEKYTAKIRNKKVNMSKNRFGLPDFAFNIFEKKKKRDKNARKRKEIVARKKNQAIPKSKGLRRVRVGALSENNSDNPHPPIFAKKHANKICHTMGSVWCNNLLKSRDFYRKDGIQTHKYGIRTPPPTPYEPFLLGVGVVFSLLTKAQKRPDVHKIVSSTKLRSPKTAGEEVSILRIFY